MKNSLSEIRKKSDITRFMILQLRSITYMDQMLKKRRKTSYALK
jgi:hypothetical protein